MGAVRNQKRKINAPLHPFAANFPSQRCANVGRQRAVPMTGAMEKLRQSSMKIHPLEAGQTKGKESGKIAAARACDLAPRNLLDFAFVCLRFA